jgi:hypothetical protein
MPRIPIPTAETGPGIIRATTTSPDSFGAQAFQGVTQLGRGFTELAAQAQHVQDQLDLVQLSSQYETQLDEARTTIAQHPDLERHSEMLEAVTQKLQGKLLKANPHISSAVHSAFQNHATKLYTTAAIDLQHAGVKAKVGRAKADFATTEEQLLEKAALAPSLDDADKHLHLLDELRANVVRQGVFSAEEGRTSQESARDKYWTIVAQRDPNRILGLQADLLDAEAGGSMGNVAGMDPEKLSKYLNLAVSTLHTQQSSADRAEKEQEALIKRLQDQNARNLTADILEGKPIGSSIPTLLRSRGLADAVGRALAELQTKLASAPDLSKYQKGLAATTEAALTKMKYDNTPLGPEVQASITDDYLRDRITKDEYGHLMAVYQSVDDHKHQDGKAEHNNDVSHAHTKLEQSLRTTGPADKFDALSNQTIVDATEFFYRRLRQQPQMDPWMIKKEAEDIFRPVIEKRLGLSKTDKAQLDDAKMQGLVHTKAMSPAALKAYREQGQYDEGWRIVQETLRNLPPPPPPGYFERWREMVTPSKERTPAGVMAGE